MALFEVEAATRVYRPAVLTNDGLLLVFLGYERNRDCFFVFQSQTGVLIHKFLARYQGAKDCTNLVPIPGKPTQIALIDQEKGKTFFFLKNRNSNGVKISISGAVFDVRTKKLVRTIRRWCGKLTKDGRLGLYAPSRGGLDLVIFLQNMNVSDNHNCY